MKSCTEKILNRQQVAEITQKLQAKGQKVGFTSGAFDLLHPGHIAYLEKAGSECDVLVVGINSDKSIKAYKDPLRPIVSESARVRVLAGLESVSYLFLFDETNNAKNIEVIKPALYFKGGDYNPKGLTSKQLVESYGGEVRILNFEKGFSTSSIITSVVGKYCHLSLDLPPTEKSPAVFVDRDGTINEDIAYLHEPEKLRLIPGALEGLKDLREKGYRIVVVTNQPGIGLGYFAKEDLFKVNLRIFQEASKVGLLIDKVYFCPHSLSVACECRKPGLDLFKKAVEELNIDVSKSYMIGDSTADMEAAKRLGCKSVLVETGKGGKDGAFDVKPTYSCSDLRAASKAILESD